MKICLYLEFSHSFNGKLYKNIGTGLLSSYKNQKVMLTHLGVSYVEKWNNSCDIIQINTPWIKSLHFINKAKRLGKKVIIWSHITLENTMSVFRFIPLVAPILKAYLAYAYNLADLIFAPTEYAKKLLIGYGLAPEKIIVQSNAVNLEKYFKNEAKRISGRKKYKLKTLTIGSAGVVVPQKGIDTFLKMVNTFSTNQFVWIGNMYSRLMVKPLPKNLPKNVKFAGYVENTNEFYNAIDILLFPSYGETEGMVILEAAAVGLPILVRDIPVYEGWLEHGKNCLKAKSDEEFVKFLQQLIDDKDLRTRLGREAKKIAKAKSIEALSKNVLSVYKKILA